MIVFGIKFWAWGSSLTQRIWKCSKCGFEGQFVEKKGMRFITLYWVIPTIPVSGITSLVQCPNCKTRYQDNNPNSSNPSAPPPLADPWA